MTGLESLCLAFLLAAQNDLQVCAADIGNAYLNGRAKEKVMVRLKCAIFGPKLAGKDVIIDEPLRTTSRRSTMLLLIIEYERRLQLVYFIMSRSHQCQLQ